MLKTNQNKKLVLNKTTLSALQMEAVRGGYRPHQKAPTVYVGCKAKAPTLYVGC